MITNLSDADALREELRTLVVDLAKHHHSRYPLELLVTNTPGVVFIDSRINVVICGLGYESGKYVIHSPYIKNNMYNPDNPNYHTKKTNSRVRALAELRRYAVSLVPQDVATTQIDSCIGMLNDWRYQFNNRVLDALRSFQTGNAAGALIESIVEYMEGTKPAYSCNATAAIATKEFALIYRENQKRYTVPPPKVHVMVNPDEVVHVSTGFAFFGGYKSSKHRIGENPSHLVYGGPLSGLPEPYRSHIAILKLVDNNQFVPDVGARVSHNSYWVYGTHE